MNSAAIHRAAAQARSLAESLHAASQALDPLVTRLMEVELAARTLARDLEATLTAPPRVSSNPTDPAPF
jgi:hypothetical protein